MSEITEKRTFKVPPCKIDKNLINELGQILEEQSPIIYDEIKKMMIRERSDSTYYKKHPDEIKSDLDSAIYEWEYEPKYELVAPSRIIKSAKVDGFTSDEWPSDAERITLSVGGGKSSREIETNIYMERWRTSNSQVSVSGKDSTWVNGIADRLETTFKSRIVGYHLIVERFSLRILISIVTWISIAFAIAYPLFPVLKPFLKEGVTWIVLFAIVSIVGGWGAIFLLEEFLKWLFPRFEFGEVSLPRRVRKWIWGLLISSGLIANIIFKLVGLE